MNDLFEHLATASPGKFSYYLRLILKETHYKEPLGEFFLSFRESFQGSHNYLGVACLLFRWEYPLPIWAIKNCLQLRLHVYHCNLIAYLEKYSENEEIANLAATLYEEIFFQEESKSSWTGRFIVNSFRTIANLSPKVFINRLLRYLAKEIRDPELTAVLYVILEVARKNPHWKIRYFVSTLFAKLVREFGTEAKGNNIGEVAVAWRILELVEDDLKDLEKLKDNPLFERIKRLKPN